MTTSHAAAEMAELRVRIHALESDARDRELLIIHLRARCLDMMERLRGLGFPEVPTDESAHHKP